MLADLFLRLIIWFTDDCGYCGLVNDSNRRCFECHTDPERAAAC
jgi:hypothetical protein